SQTAVGTRVPCKAFFDCAGEYQLVTAVARPHQRRRGRTSAQRKAKGVVLASSGLFDVPARHRRTVSAKLTKAGRRLLRPGRRVKAIVKVTSITPLGKRVTRSFKVTLRRPKARRK